MDLRIQEFDPFNLSRTKTHPVRVQGKKANGDGRRPFPGAGTRLQPVSQFHWQNEPYHEGELRFHQ